MTMKVYVEGGGRGKALRSQCQEGFSEFFARAGLQGRRPKIVACGGRGDAFRDFSIACRNARKSSVPILLVDSEEAVAANASAWAHLKAQDSWDKPEGAADDSAHLMVQCMEAWFLADMECLAEFFGQGFNRNALPRRTEVEAVPKKDLLDGLKNATRGCKSKGGYSKGSHSFSILKEVDPVRVMRASPRARSLINVLLAESEGLKSAQTSP